jgi:hypothetical protein
MFNKIKSRIIFIVFSFSRVSMSILWEYRQRHQIVQQLPIILIIFKFIKIRMNYLDVSHGPRTADIWHRHIGDLGNITTDANGTVHINIIDIIIQFYNSTQSIAGRTIVIHAMFDDGGNTSMGDSMTTGYDFVLF